MVLDARRARPVSVEVEGVDTRPGYLELGYVRKDEPDQFHLEFGMGFGGDGADRAFAEPMGPATVGRFEPSARWRLMDAAAPDVGHSPFLYDLIFYGPTIPDPPAWRVTPADHGRLARVVNHFKTMNDAADYQELRFGFAPLQEFGFLSPDPVYAPRARVEYLSPDPVRWGQEVFRFSPPNYEVDVDLFELPYAPYDAGERQDRTWYGAPFRPGFGAQRDLTTMWAGFDDLHDSDGHSGFLGVWSDDAPLTERVRLYRDGQLLADVASSYIDLVEVGQAEARYRLERDFDASALLSIASPARSVWEFTSAGSGEPEDFQNLPLLEIDYRAAPLGGRNGAVAGQPVTVDVDVHRREGTPASEAVADQPVVLDRRRHQVDPGRRDPARPGPLPGGAARRGHGRRPLRRPAGLRPRRRRRPPPADPAAGLPGALTRRTRGLVTGWARSSPHPGLRVCSVRTSPTGRSRTRRHACPPSDVSASSPSCSPWPRCWSPPPPPPAGPRAPSPPRGPASAASAPSPSPSSPVTRCCCARAPAAARRRRWSRPGGAAPGPASRSCRSAATSTSSRPTSTTWSAGCSTSTCSTCRRSSGWATPTPRRPACP